MAMTMDMRGSMARRAGRATAAERARAFRVARRHTRLVSVLRVALPVRRVCICLAYAADAAHQLEDRLRAGSTSARSS